MSKKPKPKHKAPASFGSNRQHEQDREATEALPDRKSQAAGEKPEPTPSSVSSAFSAGTSSAEAVASPATPAATASSDASAAPATATEDVEVAKAADAALLSVADETINELVAGDPLLTRSVDRPGRVIPAVIERRQWHTARAVVETLTRQAKTTHGMTADAQLMRDVAEWLRLEFDLPADVDDESA